MRVKRRGRRGVREQEDARWLTRARRGDALAIPPESWWGVGVGESFQATSFNEFIDFVFALAEDVAGEEAGLQVAADGEPGEEI